MTDVRELSEADLPAVAGLLAAAFADSWPAVAWGRLLRATLVDTPWADTAVPSLVSCSEEGTITGFIAANPLRASFDGAPIRVACAAHLAVEPGSRGSLAGPLLLRRLLAGPQDATITDTADATVRRVWESLRGRSDELRSLAWMQPLAPLRWLGRTGAAVVRRRSARLLLPVRALPLQALVPAARPPTWGRDGVPVAEVLDAGTFAAEYDAVAPAARVRPRHDVDHLGWLLGQVEATAPGSAVLRRVVRRRGRVVGWYVCRVDRDGSGRVLQVVCRQRDAADVLAELFAVAAAEGAVVLTGRVEAHLSEGLRHHRCVIGPGGRHLVHARDPALLEALTTSAFTVLDGEWWY